MNSRCVISLLGICYLIGFFSVYIFSFFGVCIFFKISGQGMNIPIKEGDDEILE